MKEFNLPLSFSQDVVDEAEAIPAGIPDEELERRADLTDLTVFTIDPADAKDFDDAISVEETGRGRLLRWPFGATWHYTSWLYPSGACGSGVHVAPMLGRSTPGWWRKVLEAATDGAVLLEAGTSREAAFEAPFGPGSPGRMLRGPARAGGLELRYRVLSAAVVPFDEDGQMIFRLRCLCGDGAGLVEIPASLPGTPAVACACGLVFSPSGVSCRTGGREVLLVESAEARQGAGAGPPATGPEGAFLSPYQPPGPGVLGRLARLFSGG